MRKPMKPDWKKAVRERMAESSRLCKQDVIDELASHLDDVYEEARARGAHEPEASQLALQEVDDWSVLAAEIARAKSKEDSMNQTTMNQRTKTVLLPAIAILFAVGLVLLFLDRAAVLQRLIWFACMALLLGVVATEANRLNLRTKSLWLPSLASLFASSFFLFVLTELSMQPELLVRLNAGAAQWLYAVWLISQIAFGALGAFLSRRVGGSRIARMVAATFPAIVMLAACAIVIPVSALMEHNDFIFHNPGRLWWGAFRWAVVPAVTLLLGAVPFLQEPSKRHA
jgi:hypothetical protein